MRNRIIGIVAFSLLVGLPGLASADEPGGSRTIVGSTRPPAPAPEPEPAKLRWPAHFEVMAKPGHQDGSFRVIGEGQIFLPLWQNSSSLLFLDLRGMGDDDHNAEGNFGLAFRKLIGESWIAGGYGFFDYRHTDRGNNEFIGGMAGGEVLTTNWDFRVNGYLPESDKKSAPAYDEVQLAGADLVIRNGVEQALYGVDGEIGWRIPFSENSVLWDTRIFAGGYWFDRSGVDSVTGPRGRLEMRFHDIPLMPKGSRFTLGGEVQWDDPRGTQGFGVARLRVPFWGFGGSPPDGSTPESRIARRMTDPIQRDVDLVTRPRLGAPRPAYNPMTGALIAGVRFAEWEGDDEDPTFTFEDPGLLDDATEDFEDGIVVALDRNGSIDTGVDPAELEEGQILMGGGGHIYVEDENGRQFPWTAPGGRAELYNSSLGEPVVTAARDNWIAGLDIYTNYEGIYASDPSGLWVTDSYFGPYEPLIAGTEPLTDFSAAQNNSVSGPVAIYVGLESQAELGLRVENNIVEGYNRGVYVHGDDAGDVTALIVDNLFLGSEGPMSDGPAIEVSLGGHLNDGEVNLDVEVTDNTIWDFGSGVFVHGEDFGTMTTEISRNWIWAPSEGGARGILVEGVGSGQMETHIIQNDVDGYYGVESYIGEGDLWWTGAAVEVIGARLGAGGMTTYVTGGNQVTAPADGSWTGIGVIGYPSFTLDGGPAFDDPFPMTVRIEDNRVDGYTGGPLPEDDGLFRFPAVFVGGYAPTLLDARVADNRVTGPDGYGWRGIGVLGLGVNAFSDPDSLTTTMTVDVVDNVVERYHGEAPWRNEGEYFLDGTAGALGVAGIGVDSLDADVSFNRVSATEEGGWHGIHVRVDPREPDNGSGTILTAAINDNVVDGYGIEPSVAGTAALTLLTSLGYMWPLASADVEILRNEITAPSVGGYRGISSDLAAVGLLNQDVSHNVVSDFEQGIDILTGSLEASVDLDVLGNQVDATPGTPGMGSGIRVELTENPNDAYVSINGNRVEDVDGDGIKVVVGASSYTDVERLDIVGNVVEDVTGDGIQLDIGSNAAEFDDDVWILDNTVRNAGIRGIFVTNDSTVGPSVIIGGNDVPSPGSYGIELNPNQSFTVSSDVDGMGTIDDNTVSSPGFDDVLLGGPGDVDGAMWVNGECWGDDCP